MSARVTPFVQGIALFYCASVFAQAPGNTITPDPGITTTRLLDRPEVRVSRLEIEPGATRRVHAHDDVQFHLFVVLTGTVQVSIGSEQAEEGKPGKVFFLKKGTKHGFTNSGKTQATALEVFIKAGAAALDRDVLGLALAWAAAQTRCGGASLSSERPAAIDAGCVK